MSSTDSIIDVEIRPIPKFIEIIQNDSIENIITIFRANKDIQCDESRRATNEICANLQCTNPTCAYPHDSEQYFLVHVLYRCVKTSSIQLLQKFIQEVPYISIFLRLQLIEGNMFPIAYAIKIGFLPMVKYLFEIGAFDQYVTIFNGSDHPTLGLHYPRGPLFHELALHSSKRVELFNHFNTIGADINYWIGLDYFPAVWLGSTCCGNLEEVKFLIQNKADVTHSDPITGYSFLTAATRSGNVDMIEFAINKMKQSQGTTKSPNNKNNNKGIKQIANLLTKSDILHQFQYDHYTINPLFMAGNINDLRVVTHFIEKYHVPINYTDPESKSTILHHICLPRHLSRIPQHDDQLKVLNLVLKSHHELIHCCDVNGFKPFDLAISNRMFNVTRQLIHHKVNPNIFRTCGILQTMARNELQFCSEAIDILFEYDTFNINYIDSSNLSPLQAAIKYDRVELVQHILQHPKLVTPTLEPTNPNAKDIILPNFISLFPLIAEYDSINIMTYLINQHQASYDLTSIEITKCMSILDLCVFHDAITCFDFLLSSSHNVNFKSYHFLTTFVDIAAKGNSLKCLDLILKVFPDQINKPNMLQQLPLTIAMINGHLEMIDKLIEVGANYSELSLSLSFDRDYTGNILHELTDQHFESIDSKLFSKSLQHLHSKFPTLLNQLSVYTPTKHTPYNTNHVYTPVQYALHYHNLEYFKHLCELGADITIPLQPFGDNIFHTLATGSHNTFLEFLQFIHKNLPSVHQLDINKPDWENHPPIIIAIQNRSVEMLSYIWLDIGANPIVHGRHIFYYALEQNDCNIIKFILDNNDGTLQINTPPTGDDIIIQKAFLRTIKAGLVDVVELLNHYYNIPSFFQFKRNIIDVLRTKLSFRNSDAYRAFKKAGFSLQTTLSSRGYNLIEEFVAQDNQYNLQHFIDMADDLEFICNAFSIIDGLNITTGLSLLHIAALHFSERCINELVDKGRIPIDILSLQQYTPLQYSIMNNEIHCAKYLISKGANISIMNDIGCNIIHYISSVDNIESIIFEWLYQEYSNLFEMCDNIGYTPLFYACQNGCYNNVRRLYNLGISLFHRSNENYTILHAVSYALYNGTKIVHFIMKYQHEQFQQLQLKQQQQLQQQQQSSQSSQSKQQSSKSKQKSKQQSQSKTASSSTSSTSTPTPATSSTSTLKLLDINDITTTGLTPLLIAASNGNIDMMRYYIYKYQAYITSITPINGWDICNWVIMSGQCNAVKWLFQQCDTISTTNNNNNDNNNNNTGKTNTNNTPNTTTKLFHPNTINSKLGYNPLHFAIIQNQVDIVKMLVNECGADTSIKTHNNQTIQDLTTNSSIISKEMKALCQEL